MSHPFTIPACRPEKAPSRGTDSCAMHPPVLPDVGVLEEAVLAAEAAEFGLAISDNDSSLAERRATGSFYTPADVAEHFWREYFSFHRVGDRREALLHLSSVQFVEPAAGAGIFLFSLLKQLTEIGCSIQDLSLVHFAAADINEAALSFVARQVSQVEARLALTLRGFTCYQADFRELTIPRGRHVSFVGNPPYVREAPGAKWRNLYATFLDRMISETSVEISIGLILPLSIAFSRDYIGLREKMRNWSRSIRLLNFDNIPDCLFKTGKPGSLNTNKANSQRCSIVFLRNHGAPSLDGTDLQRWSRKERSSFLLASPRYRDISRYDFDGQFPRPSCDWIVDYLRNAKDTVRLGDVIGKGPSAFAVAQVARNFIGIRDASQSEASSVLSFPTRRHMLWALQVLGSSLFYEYWRTVGDGFHVTRSDIDRFPLTQRVLHGCVEHEADAHERWKYRSAFARQKLNSGKEITSFDFRGQFDYLLGYVTGNDVADVEMHLPIRRRKPVQPALVGLSLRQL